MCSCIVGRQRRVRERLPVCPHASLLKDPTPMTTTLTPPPAGLAEPARDAGVPRRRTRIFALPEVRWATAATVLFLLALPLQLTGAPAWTWGPLYALSYATGGWEPGWEGLKALKDRTLDVDLLMVVAALGAASIGQVMDGALLIVIFATSGALEALATARTADSCSTSPPPRPPA
jgi:cation transport ATPase